MTHLPRLSGQDKLQPCVMQVLRVSGTIRKAEEEVIRRARAAILKARRESHDGDATGLDAILGSADKETLSRPSRKDKDLEMGIEDADADDDDEAEDQESMDEDD